jgi:hypothetical protein
MGASVTWQHITEAIRAANRGLRAIELAVACQVPSSGYPELQDQLALMVRAGWLEEHAGLYAVPLPAQQVRLSHEDRSLLHELIESLADVADRPIVLPRPGEALPGERWQQPAARRLRAMRRRRGARA